MRLCIPGEAVVSTVMHVISVVPMYPKPQYLRLLCRRDGAETWAEATGTERSNASLNDAATNQTLTPGDVQACTTTPPDPTTLKKMGDSAIYSLDTSSASCFFLLVRY
jgi:hypothetical protein